MEDIFEKYEEISERFEEVIDGYSKQLDKIIKKEESGEALSSREKSNKEHLALIQLHHHLFEKSHAIIAKESTWKI